MCNPYSEMSLSWGTTEENQGNSMMSRGAPALEQWLSAGPRVISGIWSDFHHGTRGLPSEICL